MYKLKLTKVFVSQQFFNFHSTSTESILYLNLQKPFLSVIEPDKEYIYNTWVGKSMFTVLSM